MRSRISTAPPAFFLALIIVFLHLAAESTPPAPSLQLEPHDFRAHGLDCRSCHTTIGLKKPGSLQKPVGEICAGCHKLLGQSHPVDIKPSFPIPQDLPLDERGMMTCATCHDPHRGYLNPITGEKTKYLRRDGSTRMLCTTCHKK